AGLLATALLVAIASLRAIGRALRRRPQVAASGTRELAWNAALGGALAGGVFSLASGLQPNAVRNVLVLFAVTSATLLPLAFERSVTRAGSSPAGSGTLAWARLALVLLVGIGLRDPRRYLPTERDVADWRGLHARLARLGPPDRTWVALHG